MSKIEELIQQYCPDGVEYVKLGEVCEISIGEFVHKTLQKEENPVDSDGNVIEQAKKDKWTDEDDAYYFILHQEINGVPVEQLSYGDGYEGTGIEATELSAIYGTKGWISFIEDWGYCLEETETEQDILSVKDALDSFRKKCDMLLLDQKWTIRDISLKLLPVFIKDNEL